MTDPLAALLPCPFCGAAPRVIEDDTYGDCQVFCVCDAEPCVTRPMAEMADARSAWNRRALLAREQAAGWQPIETAPKDDSDFQALGCHQDEDGHSWSYYIINRHDVGGRYECWVVPPGRPINPTHWMPLPAPPSLPAKEPT